MIILALDQASRVSGYSVFDNDKLVTYGKFSFDNQDIAIRLNHIKTKVRELIQQHQPNKIILEDIQLQNNNVTTYKALAQVQGTLLELCAELKLEYEIVSSNTWKSYCGVVQQPRPASKQAAQKHVLDKYGIKATQDESDAICIGEYASNNRGAW